MVGASLLMLAGVALALLSPEVRRLRAADDPAVADITGSQPGDPQAAPIA
jgi:hypothetical protein